MALQTTGEIRIEQDRATAFAFVQDPLRLAQCIPGCQHIREIAPGRFEALLTNRVAFITLSFKVVVEIVKIEPPNTIEAKIAGQAVGMPGSVMATAALLLTELDESHTLIRYTANAALTGKLGGLGEPVFRAKSAEVAREFAATLKAAIEGQRMEQPR